MVSTSNFDRLIKNIDSIKEKQNKLLDGIANVMGRNTRLRFDKETTPEGEKWTPLSEVTLSMRRNKNKSSAKILQDTGRLKSSINTKVDYQNAEVRIGTNVEYAETHQKGGFSMLNGNITKIPKREFLGISERDYQDINRLLKRFIEDIREAIGKWLITLESI